MWSGISTCPLAPSTAVRHASAFRTCWCPPTPDDVDEYIKLAKRSGLRMILFSYKAFSQGAGHFLWNSHYPNGITDLKRVADAIRGAGLKVGLHIHYSKAHKNDPYVTPVPDERFHKIRTFTFAADMDSRATTIPVNENPKGSMLDDGRRILKAAKQLIAYTRYTTTPPFQFTGCQRRLLKRPQLFTERATCWNCSTLTTGTSSSGSTRTRISRTRMRKPNRRDIQRNRPVRHGVLRRG